MVCYLDCVNRRMQMLVKCGTVYVGPHSVSSVHCHATEPVATIRGCGEQHVAHFKSRKTMLKATARFVRQCNDITTSASATRVLLGLKPRPVEK